MDIRTQCAAAVMMIRPAAFDFNAQTAASNRMQSGAVAGTPGAAQLAIAEFDAAVAALRGAGVWVSVQDDSPTPPKPDAVFPNNWVSWHCDGTVVLYPMEAENRRYERRRGLVASVAEDCEYPYRRILDLSGFEQKGRYLEGTGSLVLDHSGRRAFACRSSRTDENLVRRWADELGYEPVVFDATDAAGVPYYHTNVMLSIGCTVAVVATESIARVDRERVLGLLGEARETIEIDRAAVAGFAGNMLELATATGGTVYALSASAERNLSPAARTRLAANTGALLPIAIPTIERLGGGSVRCMIAEVFSPT